MQKIYFSFLKHYLNFLSFIYPKYGGKIAINFFQKVRLRKIKPKELPFYEKVKTNQLKLKNGTLNYYELGNLKGEIVFLVHGWDSNAGSLSNFAFALAKQYRIISLDLPAHAKSSGTHTNLFESKDALKKLINHINPQQTFNIIGHSFGAAVLVYALAELNKPINKIVLLSANNVMRFIFDDYQKLIGFNNKIYEELEKWVKLTIDETLDNLVLTDKLKQIHFDKLLVIHDKFDKVLPYHNALEIKESLPQTTLVPFEKIGHYRMLWNEDVLKTTLQFLDKS